MSARAYVTVKLEVVRKKPSDPRARLPWLALGFLLLAILVLSQVGCASAPEWSRVEALRAQGTFVARVRSSVSMHGYRAGDHLRVTVSDFSKIKAGDPVYFWDYSHPVPSFHVAIRKTTQGWVTQGTANANTDPQLLTERTYIGRWEVAK